MSTRSLIMAACHTKTKPTVLGPPQICGRVRVARFLLGQFSSIWNTPQIAAAKVIWWAHPAMWTCEIPKKKWQSHDKSSPPLTNMSREQSNIFRFHPDVTKKPLPKGGNNHLRCITCLKDKDNPGPLNCKRFKSISSQRGSLFTYSTLLHAYFKVSKKHSLL